VVRDGALQLTLSGTQDLAEITHPDYPGERLVACMNPFLAAERARKRESLLAATEADLAKITAATRRARQPLRGTDKIALRADRVLRRRKVARHFTTAITDDRSSPPTSPCPASDSSPPQPRSNGAPSTCSPSATASAPRSQQPSATAMKPQVNGHAHGSSGGTSV
jgi:hypothetical protein